MSASTIGIKVADGTYYPVLEKGFTGKKKLTVTTVKDSQTRVQIDLYRGDGAALEQAQYIGSLIIENIVPGPKGEAEIDLLLSMDEAEQLVAEASDRRTGESQSFSISLRTLSEEDTYDLPEFELGGEKPLDFEEPPLTGETYPIGGMDRRQERAYRGGPSRFLVVLVVILGILLLAAAAYIVYKTFLEPRVSAAGSAAADQAAEAEAVAEAPVSTAVGTSADKAAASSPATAVAAAASAKTADKGVTYRIKTGDTLWDISSTYYRNPWLYPRLARANSIRDPDLILAGAKIFIPED